MSHSVKINSIHTFLHKNAVTSSSRAFSETYREVTPENSSRYVASCVATTRTDKFRLNYEKNLILLILLLLSWQAKYFAQDFNYSISLDTTSGYTALDDAATNLSNGGAWLPKYEIPTGFSAASKQSIILETNGYTIYDRQNNFALMAFNGFHCKVDSASAYSKLSYHTTGAQGSKILKIEFKNVGQGDAPHELISYQVWVKESGGFEVVVGPGTYNTTLIDSLIDTNQVVHIGLINRNMDKENNGIFISGKTNIPVSAPLNSTTTEIAYMRSIPKKGFKYIFTPLTN